MHRSQFSLSFSLLTSVLCLGLLVNCGEPPEPGYEGNTGGMVGATGGVAGGTGGSASGGTGATAGGGTPGSTCAAPTVPFEVSADEPTNMSLNSTLSLEPGHVYQGSTTDLFFDWSGVTTDFFGHPLAASEIVVVALVGWLPGTDVAKLINEDSADINDFVAFPPVGLANANGVTSVALSDFIDLGGNPLPENVLEFLDPARGYIYTLILQDESTVGIGARMIHSFTLDAASTDTNVVLQNTSTSLTASATLGQSVQVPAATPGITVEWASAIDTRSFGGEFLDNGISEVLVGRYDPAFDVGGNILDIEISATNLYRGAPLFSEFDLSTLTDAQGQPFPGIDASGQWVMALVCGTCSNPSPWYLTKLEPCP